MKPESLIKKMIEHYSDCEPEFIENLINSHQKRMIAIDIISRCPEYWPILLGNLGVQLKDFLRSKKIAVAGFFEELDKQKEKGHGEI